MAEGQSTVAPAGRVGFEKELVTHLPALRAFSRSLERNPAAAEDLVQDTVVKALTNWHQFEPGTSLKAWTFAILRNAFLSGKRRSWRSQPLDSEMAENLIGSGDDIASQEEVIQDLCAIAPVLATFPHARRDAFVAVAYLGLSYEEAAEIVGCAVGTVKSMLSRARDTVSEALASGKKYRYDVRAWIHATKRVPKNHPYYPIAKAYEDIAAFLREASTDDIAPATKADPETDGLEKAWEDLLASGALEEEEAFDRLMRR